MTSNVMTKKRIDIKVSEGIENLTPYPPGKPIEELERELGVTDSIKIASNENPLGPSKKAKEVLHGAIDGLNRYPDGSNFYLKEKLAKKLVVKEDMLVFGNGSNEIIELLIRTFCDKGDEVIMGKPSFAVYPIISKASGAVPIEVPLKENFDYDLDGIINAITDKTKLIFIANPNNPTGTSINKNDFESFIKKLPTNIILCMDEAYVEYVKTKDFPDSIPYILQGLPIVSLRTFSKIYGLAGLRIGYMIADEKITNYINRVRQPFNVNSLAQIAALAALDDDAHVEESRRVNEQGMEFLFKELELLGCVCVESEANFFLIKVGEGTRIYEELLKRGVIVRAMKGFGLDEYIRITVGTKEENERFLKDFKEVLNKNKK